MPNRVYVLDTSVLIHDPKALFRFTDNTVAIPIYVVMELDGLKNNKRHEVASASRIASKMILSLLELDDHKALFNGGLWHAEHRIKFKIVSHEAFEPGKLIASPAKGMADQQILSSAVALKETFDEVILVTKDVNLRLLADFADVKSEDYNTDRVELDELFKGYQDVEEYDPSPLAVTQTAAGVVPLEEMGLTGLMPNEFVRFTDASHPILTRYFEGEGLKGVPYSYKHTDVRPRNDEQRMALSLLMDPSVKLVTLVGKAGTGKTFLTLAAGLAQMQGPYDRILLSKPVVAMGNDVGYLPGDFDAKMQPWMQSFFDNLDQLMPTSASARDKGATRDEKSWEYFFEAGLLQVQAIHSIRGRSIPNAFMVIDEAQNLTPHEVKTIITRAAEGTKVVLLGDPYQVDNHFLDRHTNGLVYVTERLKSSDVTGAVFFSTGERSQLAELAAELL